MILKESGEMYLETIYVLRQKKPFVRAIDVASELGYSKPSVSRAERTYERHTVLSEMFMRLGVDEENAVNDACRIEHVISDATFSAIKKHMERYTA